MSRVAQRRVRSGTSKPLGPRSRYQAILVPIDPNALKVGPGLGGGYGILYNGKVVLSGFFSTRAAAVFAIKLLKFYQATAVGAVGTVFGYFLVGPQAPQGPMPGEYSFAINPNNLTVEFHCAGWTVCDGNHWMVPFGNDKAAAVYSANLLRKHQLGQEGYCPPPPTKLPFFVYFRH